MRAVLAAGGCGFEDVVKVTVFLTDIDDRPLHQSRAAGGLRRDAARVDAGRGAAPRRRRARRSRSSASPSCRERRSVQRVHHARRARRVAAAARSRAGRSRVKDLFDTAGVRTTYGSGLYADHVPERNAVAVQRLLDAGAVIVGKTHLPGVRVGRARRRASGTARVTTRAHPGKTTGGSSSGSAAALAAGLCELALGSDTGCSIRLPSAACEVVGLKSQWGLIPTDGVFPLVPTLDTVGPMARSVEDVALMWSVLTERPMPEPRLAGLTVGLLRQPPGIGDGRETETSDAAEAWVADLERLGARVVEARVPEPSREHLAAVPARGAAVARGDLPEPRRRVRRGDAEEARGGPARDAGGDRRRVPRDRGVAALRARRRSLRQPLLRDRAARPRTRTSSRSGSRSRRSCAG